MEPLQSLSQPHSASELRVADPCPRGLSIGAKSIERKLDVQLTAFILIQSGAESKPKEERKPIFQCEHLVILPSPCFNSLVLCLLSTFTTGKHPS
jgi:hypothetical protein